MQFPESNFWNFSIRFYQITDIEKSCLVLQDNYQLNVNLILFCHWITLNKQQALSQNQWQTLVIAAQPWEDIIHTLRKSRRMITNSSIAWPTDFKQETSNGVSDIEINTEHMQQLAIEQAWKAFEISESEDNQQDILRHNIKNYLIASNSQFTIEQLQKELDTIKQASTDFQLNNQTMAL